MLLSVRKLPMFFFTFFRDQLKQFTQNVENTVFKNFKTPPERLEQFQQKLAQIFEGK